MIAFSFSDFLNIENETGQNPIIIAPEIEGIIDSFQVYLKVTSVSNLSDRDSIFVIVMDKNYPFEFKISDCYPNPFNNSTNIPISIPFKSEIQISIYGATKDVDETIRVGRKFNMVTRNCKLLNEYAHA